MKILVDEYVILLAVRYALGRKTYVVSEVTKEVKDHWSEFSDSLKHQIHHDVEIALLTDNAGMQMDKDEWKEVYDLKV